MNLEHELGRYKKKVLDMEKESGRLREEIEGLKELQKCYMGIISVLSEKVFEGGRCEFSFEEVNKAVKNPKYFISADAEKRTYILSAVKNAEQKE